MPSFQTSINKCNILKFVSIHITKILGKLSNISRDFEEKGWQEGGRTTKVTGNLYFPIMTLGGDFPECICELLNIYIYIYIDFE